MARLGGFLVGSTPSPRGGQIRPARARPRCHRYHPWGPPVKTPPERVRRPVASPVMRTVEAHVPLDRLVVRRVTALPERDPPPVRVAGGGRGTRKPPVWPLAPR